MQFNKTLTTGDLAEVNLAAKAGTFTAIYSYTVPAQQLVAPGSGAITGGVDNRAILYVDLKDSTPAQIGGWVRISVTDANEITEHVVLEERIERLSASATDRQLAYFLGKAGLQAKEDSKIQIRFKPDTDATVVTANSTVYLPVTVNY